MYSRNLNTYILCKLIALGLRSLGLVFYVPLKIMVQRYSCQLNLVCTHVKQHGNTYEEWKISVSHIGLYSLNISSKDVDIYIWWKDQFQHFYG
jgi:hypothetical protein